MAGSFIHQQRDLPGTIVMMNQFEKCLKVTGSLARSRQKQPMSAGKVHGSKNNLSRIPARQSNLSHFTATSPASPQRWKQEQIGFIFRKYHTTWRQGAQLSTNVAFFSPGQGLRPGHTDSVSRHSPGGARRGGWYHRKSECYRRVRVALARVARSNWLPDSQAAQVAWQSRQLKVPWSGWSSAADDRSAQHHRDVPDQSWPCSWRASYT